ncbi:MAG TPA: aspartyl/asparaginyl beta-hydroxylase domain-containing protein [Actinophytocola sp.]|uniref:aspartyl/asparaginyl beta-hydroxylase domain-containing protein n=1 Tax=Actinophytocola sp. TaxID=1872138 RepID=UPI002DDD00BD|nr:aspartyl/asparaginyl beta-hydroxylase domain-containing protein [Actinophytocola sp.]HEV2780515.1 aspartyl/asparaginyl beta-hydroxylase domain-containing protein [Actinophytocola sp.]
MSAETIADVQAGIPDVVRLTPRFDVSSLVRDVESLRAEQASEWKRQKTFISDDNLVETELDWHTLPLRSTGGDKSRTDPGGPGLEPFADTAYAEHAPYLRTVMSTIPSPLRSVRLMALGPDTYGPDHFDNKYALTWGIARLHVPVITLPEAKLFFGETPYVWEAGALWFGNFARTHRIENSGRTHRVHLLLDVHVTDEFFDLFPADARAELNFDNIMINRHEQPVRPDPVHQIAFEVPKSFTDWEEEDGQFLLDQPTVAAEIKAQDDELVLHYDGVPYAGLVHIGDNEFRFQGWTDERTVQVVDEAGQRRVVLRTRIGTQVRTKVISASPLGD